MNKVLVIGLDGGTWNILDPLLEKGKLPNIKAHMEKGLYGILNSTIPPSTVPAWPSFMTGNNPGKNGVFDFMVREGKGTRLNSSRNVSGHKIWDILSDNGLRSIVINIPCTYPPQPLNGVMVTGMMTPKKEGFTFPKTVEKEINENFPDYQFELDPFLTWKKHEEPTFIEELHKLSETRKDLCIYLMDHYKWDFFIVLFRGTDILFHKRWDDKENVELYMDRIDRIIEELYKKAGEDTNLFIISDHGFERLDYFVNLNRWLEKEGYLKYYEKDYQKRGEGWETKYKEEKSFDIYRVFHSAGVTQERMLGLTKYFNVQRLKKLIPKGILQMLYWMPSSKKEINYSRSKAFSTPISVKPVIVINQSGREPEGIVSEDEYETLRQEIINKVKEIKNPYTNKKVVKKAYKREEIYKGPFIQRADDIILLLENGYRTSLSFRTDEVIIPVDRIGLGKGNHAVEGIIIASGPNIPKESNIPNAKIYDMAPTILKLFNIELPDDFDGKSIL